MKVAKRLLDLAVATPLAIATAPLVAGLAVAVGVFEQQRPGLHGAPFTILKLRTMPSTPFRELLRRTSIDELPQLWNVVKGDMSLVGPRPLLMHYLPLYSERQARRHDVKPGITGWAQVNGRNAITWEEKLELDVWYVENMSLLLDLRILARTAVKVLRREGTEPMPEFRGT